MSLFPLWPGIRSGANTPWGSVHTLHEASAHISDAKQDTTSTPTFQRRKLKPRAPDLRYSNGGIFLLTTLENPLWSQWPCFTASWELIHKVIWQESSTAELLKIKQQTLGEPRLSAIIELRLWLRMKCQMWPSPRDVSKNSWGGNFPPPEHRLLSAHRHVP